MAQAGDEVGHLVARQLAALARLGALRHLDLEFVGLHQVARGDAEARRGDLLDPAVAHLAVGLGRVPVGVLAPLAAVGARAHAVHPGGEGGVGLGAERAERHRGGDEAAADRLGRLDRLDRQRRPGGAQLQQVAQRQRRAVARRAGRLAVARRRLRERAVGVRCPRGLGERLHCLDRRRRVGVALAVATEAHEAVVG